MVLTCPLASYVVARNSQMLHYKPLNHPIRLQSTRILIFCRVIVVGHHFLVCVFVTSHDHVLHLFHWYFQCANPYLCCMDPTPSTPQHYCSTTL